MAGGNGGGTRCAVLIGPYQGGKTTLFEALLHATGAIERTGSVTAGNTVGDAAAEARKRHASTELAIGSGSFLGDAWTFIDTPGSVEFSQEARNACMVADIAIVVVDSEAQKLPAVAPALKFLDEYRIPRVVFLNKIDNTNDTVRDLMATLQDASDRPLALRHVPIREGESITGFADLVSERAYAYSSDGPSKLIPLPDTATDRQQEAREELLETLADFDDDLMEKVLEEVEIDKSELYTHLAQAMQDAALVPVLIGAGEQGHGIQRLLKLLRHEAPGHAESAARRGVEPDGEAVAQVFKTLHAQHMGKLSFVRLWRGGVRDGETLNGVRVSGMNAVLGTRYDKISSAEAGDVVAFGRMESIHTGDLLTSSGDTPDGALAWPEVLAPVYARAISASNRNDEVKLSGALQRLCEEDPSITISHNAAMGELVVFGQGDTQILVLAERLSNRFNLEVGARAPSVPYKETIRKQVDQHARHKKQSGGHGQFGDIKVKIKPLSRGIRVRVHRQRGRGVGAAQLHSVGRGRREGLHEARSSRLRGGRPVGGAVRRPASLRRQFRHGIQDRRAHRHVGGTAQVQPGPAGTGAACAHLDPERRDGAHPADHLQPARPDPWLPGQGRLEGLGRGRGQYPRVRGPGPDHRDPVGDHGSGNLRMVVRPSGGTEWTTC